MSKTALEPIVMPEGITFQYKNNVAKVKGPLGEQTLDICHDITLKQKNNTISLTSKGDDEKNKAFIGLYKALIRNMIEGVTKGFYKELEMVGAGYRLQEKDKILEFFLGYSHPITYTPPEGISIETQKVPNPNLQITRITVKGTDKKLVGEEAAKIRGFRPPDAYKEKGIRYRGEYVKLKPGKRGVAIE